jgi:hypothetical protein
MDYHIENTVDWIGGYVQTEHTTADGSIYGMLGWAQNSYTFVDFFTDDGTGDFLTLETGWLDGYRIKGGAVRNLTQEWSVFGRGHGGDRGRQVLRRTLRVLRALRSDRCGRAGHPAVAAAGILSVRHARVVRAG